MKVPAQKSRLACTAWPLIVRRPWLVLLVATWSVLTTLPAQEEGTEAPVDAGPAPAAPAGSSSFGAAPAGSPTSEAPPTAPPGGTSDGGALPGAAPGGGFGSPFGADSAGPSRTEEAPSTFAVTPEYGQVPQIFTAGEGRLARPRFKTTLGSSIGFDDNVFQTGTNLQDVPEQVIRQQISAGTEEQIILVPIPGTGYVPTGPIGPAPRPQKFRRVVIPAVEPEFQEIVIPGVKAAERRSSVISHNSLSFEVQTATRRQLFTFNLNVNSDFYWNRPGKKSEFNGSLALIYLRRLTSRMQFTASINANYLSQPDLSIANTPTQQGAGNYLTARTKADLSYRWTRRFSTVGSLSYNTLLYEDELRQGGNFSETVLGLEGRYLWSPRLTAVLEGRFAQVRYENSPTLNSSSAFALVGFDLSLTRRTGATLRVGEAIRTFEDSGERTSAPYLETALNYQLGRASFLQWNTRFGFEEPPDPATEVLVLRSGVSLSQFFTPRLRGSAGLNFIRRSNSNDQAQIESVESTVDANLSLVYTLSRHWTTTFSYGFTTLFADQEAGDYYRNRIFLGAGYDF